MSVCLSVCLCVCIETGSEKCGTTSMYRYLTQHPQVLPLAQANADEGGAGGGGGARGDGRPVPVRRAIAHAASAACVDPYARRPAAAADSSMHGCVSHTYPCVRTPCACVRLAFSPILSLSLFSKRGPYGSKEIRFFDTRKYEDDLSAYLQYFPRVPTTVRTHLPARPGPPTLPPLHPPRLHTYALTHTRCDAQAFARVCASA
jgi:hypothetical protein